MTRELYVTGALRWTVGHTCLDVRINVWMCVDTINTCLSADEVYKQVANGMAFREAYQKVKADFFAQASASDNGAAATH